MQIDRHTDDFLTQARRQGGSAFFPALARRLVSDFWLREGQVLDAFSYGTARWLTADPLAERLVIHRFAIGARYAHAEALPANVRSRYEALDLSFRSDSPTFDECSLFTEALTWLDRQPGLLETIALMVRSVHYLVSPGPGYDISHSDPDLPFSIFVSLPIAENNAALRLAESILHEAMHLQLTLVEQAVPLIRNAQATGFSPWQQKDRPVRGLMHGLYVFRAIDEWLGAASESGLGFDQHHYVAKRRGQIAEEIAMVSDLGSSPALTERGRHFVQWLIDGRGSGNASSID
ncbi:aKG-HExxH-type peptide beta-hydroxylase [Mesorhizobium dulcispinae]|uniref:aKG-HExxH-type peptide beta-hydroxylase n=1 Tax=Mesorhizobium dulcispinae TaxID=3072316 RepID=UPI002A249C1E|nr:HEXXH motif-containing putative peptide modification protein [Mesorhizobium sp. VK23D]MDX8522066.1 HEXXH motif-containing putative peptide modification protein [Mesorhizobium sp. VK23D]